MPELYKGFVPFSKVDEKTTYYDEVGNDVDPHGWNTASAMTWASATVTGADNKVYKIMKATVNTAISGEGFINGIWNGLKEDTPSHTYVEPKITSLTITPNLIDKDNMSGVTQIETKVSYKKGSDNISKVSFIGKSGSTELFKSEIENPTNTDLNFILDEDQIEALIETGVSSIDVSIVIDDGKELITKTEKLNLVNEIIFGSSIHNEAEDVILAMATETDLTLIQKRAIPYSEHIFTLSSFYPREDIEYMYIAVPAQFGKITRIFKGAAYEISDDEWKETLNLDYKGVKYNIYVLQYRNQGTYEFRVTIN